MSEQAYHIQGFTDLDDAKICYWKDKDGHWLLYLPNCGVGNLSNHQVTEHEDGTISVTPSIRVTGHDHGSQVIRHGNLTRGVWVEA